MPSHGSSTPQRTLSSAAHTFVASYQSFGANLDSDLRSPAKHLPDGPFRVQVLASQQAKAIFRPFSSVAEGLVTQRWPPPLMPRLTRTPHMGNSFVGADVGTADGSGVVGAGVGRGVGIGVGTGVGVQSSGRPASPSSNAAAIAALDSTVSRPSVSSSSSSLTTAAPPSVVSSIRGQEPALCPGTCGTFDNVSRRFADVRGRRMR